MFGAYNMLGMGLPAMMGYPFAAGQMSAANGAANFASSPVSHSPGSDPDQHLPSAGWAAASPAQHPSCYELLRWRSLRCSLRDRCERDKPNSVHWQPPAYGIG
jgi:hypothetical protein